MPNRTFLKQADQVRCDACFGVALQATFPVTGRRASTVTKAVLDPTWLPSDPDGTCSRRQACASRLFPKAFLAAASSADSLVRFSSSHQGSAGVESQLVRALDDLTDELVFAGFECGRAQQVTCTFGKTDEKLNTRCR